MPRNNRRNFDLGSSFQYFTPGMGGSIALLLWLLAGAFLGSMVILLLSSWAGAPLDSGTTLLISYPLMFVPPLIYASYRSHRNAGFEAGYRLDNKHFSPIGGAVAAVVVSLATLAAGFACDAINSIMPPMPTWLEDALNSATTGNLWTNLLCVSVMAPLFEEWLCRGMILRGLLNHRSDDGRRMSPAAAIIISALFFGLIHANPWQAIPAFALGCLMGWVYYRTGSLKLTMLMHCVNNTFSVLMSRVDAFQDAENWPDVIGWKMYWIVFSACVLLLILSVRAIRRIPLQGAAGNCDRVGEDFDQVSE